MAKMDIVTRPGESDILIAKPEGFGWGPGEVAPHFEHHLIDTSETPPVLRSRYKIIDKKLVLQPEEEWAETKQANALKLQEHIDAVLKDDYTTLGGIEVAVAEARVRLEAGREVL